MKVVERRGRGGKGSPKCATVYGLRFHSTQASSIAVDDVIDAGAAAAAAAAATQRRAARSA